MKLRLFTAINLPKEGRIRIKRELERIRPLFGFPIRFAKEENLHLTVSFLGYQEAGQLTPILDAMREIAEKRSSFEIRFIGISYGPIKEKNFASITEHSAFIKDSARMIWLNGTREASKKVSDLKFTLEEKLVDNNVPFKRDKRPYQAHITLSRFDNKKISDLPNIDCDLDLRVQVESLELMQSYLAGLGTRYESLAKFEFKD